MTIRLIETGEPLADHLEQYKQYASIPDDSRDGILHKLLKNAMLTVQEYSDTAILPCRFEVEVTDVKRGGTVRLYQGGTDVLTVVDGDGNDVEYRKEVGQIRILKNCASLVVTYTNTVVLPEAERLLPICWELATAIYDGEDAKAQGAILKKTYGLS